MHGVRLQHCPVCGGSSLFRRKRTFWEKFRHAAVYRCPNCRFEAAVPITVLYPQLSSVARCPHCATTDLKLFPKRDHIETMYGNPLSRVQRLFGAPLLYCQICRLQFYDFRPQANPNGDKIR